MAQPYSTQFPPSNGPESSGTEGGWQDGGRRNEQPALELQGIPSLENESDRLTRSSPSLPIILISAACGIGAGVIGFYFASELAGLGVQVSAGVATLSLCFGLGLSGALLSSVTRSQAAVSNILFSCGLVVISLLFFALCTAAGAVAATLILALGG